MDTQNFQKTKAYSANFVNTAFMRNFLATSKEYRSRTCELRDREDEYHLSLTIWRGERKPANQLFCINYKGKKNVTWEKIYSEAREKLNLSVVQGPDDIEETVALESQEKKENVIVVSEHVPNKVNEQIQRIRLTDLSSTEKTFDYAKGIDGIMDRWFLLDKINVGINDVPTNNGGMLKSWVIPRDLISRLKTAINVLFIKGFVYGEYEVEFKLILQANPFQAGLLMLATCPYSYGVVDKASTLIGVRYKLDGLSVNRLVRTYGYTTTSTDSYMDYKVAIQRPNILIDISEGGEGNLTLPFKFHKSFIRNFDYSMEDTVNPGISGSNFGSIGLFVLSPLRTGSGNESSYNARVMYRFKRANLAGMSNEAKLISGTKNLISRATIHSKYTETLKNSIQKIKEEMSKLDVKDSQYRAKMQKYNQEMHSLYLVHKHTKAYVQGPVMSMIHGGRDVVDSVDNIISDIEKINFSQRKGIKIRNKDKPIDNLSYCQVVPRSRREFGVAKGIDDAVTLATSNVEGINFYETYPDEPKNFKDLVNIKSYFSRFDWESSKTPGSTLFKWNLDPQIAPNFDRNNQTKLSSNELSSTLCSSLTMFTNYWGTIELTFQFIKTKYHRGAIEISVAFGRELAGDETLSSYVKICNIEDHNTFTFTIPYIYDTITRKISGTSLPLTLPDITNSSAYDLFSAATLQVKVVNALSNPSSVNGVVECLVWMKAGSDFGMNFLRPANTVVFPQTVGDNEDYWYNSEKPFLAYKSNAEYNQYYYGISSIDVLPKVVDAYVTQAPEEDFIQQAYKGNPLTSNEHTDFKDILKMPIKIISSYTYTNLVVFKPIDDPDSSVEVRNYISLPVAPINLSLWKYLRHYIDIPRGIGRDYTIGQINGTLNLTQSVQYQINSMFSLFKGSLSYTILTYEHKDITAPIYVAYVPHDYHLRDFNGPLSPVIAHAMESNGVVGDAHIYRWPLGSNSDSFIDIANAGTYLGVIIPSVNPSERFNIPMSTMNNWLLMNRSINRYNPQFAENIISTMREQSEWFNGHLVFYSTNDFKFDIFMSCGDDLELGGFLGKWTAVNPWAAFSMKDNWRTQGPISLDFPIKALALEEWNAFKQNPWGILSNWAKTNWELLFSLGMYLPGLTGEISQKLAICLMMRSGARRLNDAREIVEGPIGRTIKGISKSLEGESEQEAISFMTLLTRLFPSIGDVSHLKDSIWNLCTNLIHAIIAQSWQNTSFAIVNILWDLKLITTESIKTIGCALRKWMEKLFKHEVQAPNQQGSDDDFIDTITLIATTLAATFQVKSVGGVINYAKEIINWNNFKYVAGLSSIMNFTRRFFVMIQGTIRYLTKEKDPLIDLLSNLKDHKGELADFVNEATLYLNAFNDNDMKLVKNRVRFLKTIFRAYQLRSSLIAIGRGDQVNHLVKMCESVIKKAEQQKYLLRCDIIKSEPYVLAIESEAGVGKSFAATRIASEILKAYDYNQTNADVMYTINPGVAYWNGYNNQPILLYDDWCNLRDETMITHISQLYSLKTSAPFNVPRAELDNKEQMADPIALLLCTNNAFPEHEYFTQKEAIYRRRDKLVKFIKSNPNMTIADYTKEQLANFENIKVQLYDDVLSRDSLQTQELSFQEFLEVLKVDVKKYKIKEANNREVKYRHLTQHASKSMIDEISLVNPFDLLRKANEDVMSDKLTSEVMEADLLRLYELLKQSNLQNEITPDVEEQIKKALTNQIENCDSSVQAPLPESYQKYVVELATWFNDLTISKCTNHQLEISDILRQCKILSRYRVCPIEEVKSEILDILTKGCPDCTLGGWALNWFQRIKKGAIYNLNYLIDNLSLTMQVCTRCMTKQRTSTWFLCGEHDHGICIDCVVKITHKDGNVSFSCRDHECQAKIDSRGLLSSLLGALTYMAGKGLLPFLHLAKELLSGSIIKSLLYLVTYATFRKIPLTIVQAGDDDYNYVIDDFHEWDDHEAFIDTQVYRQQKTKYCAKIEPLTGVSMADLERLHPLRDKMDEIKAKYNISNEDALVILGSPCKHKLALNGFYYSSGSYIVDLQQGSYSIEDTVCCNNCLLKNISFCKYLWRVYKGERSILVFNNYVKQHLYSEVLSSVPRFAILPCHRTLDIYKKEILFLTEVPWYEYYIPKCGSWLISLIKKLAPALTVVGVIVAAWKSFGLVFNFIYDATYKFLDIPQDSGDKVMELRNKVRNRRIRKQKGNKDVVHAVSVNNKLDQQMDKIASNYIILEVKGVKFVSLAVKSNVILLNRHIWERIKKHNIIKIISITREWEFIDIDVTNMKVNFFPGKDLITITFPGALRFCDITKFFITERDLERNNIMEAIMMEVDAKQQEIYDVDLSISNYKTGHTAECAITHQQYTTDKVVEYNYGKPGICGSVITINHDRPILGLHISGKNTCEYGCGVIITQEDLAKIGVNEVQGYQEIEDTMDDCLFFGVDCNVHYEGTVKKELTPHVPSDTNLVESIISSQFEKPSKMMPAILSKKHELYEYPHSPLYYGVKKNGLPPKPFDMRMVRQVTSYVINYLCLGTYLKKPEVYDVKTAILGPNIEVKDLDENGECSEGYYNYIPEDTSPGWPYCVESYRREYNASGKGKIGWLTYIRDELNKPVDVELNPKILKDIEENSSIRKNGQLAPTIFCDLLKDEKRKIEKALKPGGTRLFSMASLEHTISLRRYTLDLTTHLRYNRINNRIAIGINTESLEWNKLYSLLTDKDFYFTTDFSNFGAGLQIDIVNSFSDLIQKFYNLKNEECIEARVLIRELAESMHIVGNTVYRTKCGSPSGAAITAEINSYSHLVYAGLVWLIVANEIRSGFLEYPELKEYFRNKNLDKLKKLAKEMTLEEFHTNVYMCVYGDDGIFGVSEAYKEVYNGVVFNVVMAKHGIGVTDASKLSKIVEFSSIKEVSFLKRKFKPFELCPLTLMVAAIEWDSVVECVRWVHKEKGKTEKEILFQNIEASLYLAWGHGKEVYELWYEELFNKLRNVNIRIKAISWEDILRQNYPDFSLDIDVN